jgi:hypothetical protein
LPTLTSGRLPIFSPACARQVEAAPTDPRSRLDAFFQESFSARVLDPKLLKVWTSFWILADRSPHVQATHERNNVQYRELLEGLLLDLGAACLSRAGAASPCRHRLVCAHRRSVAGMVPGPNDIYAGRGHAALSVVDGRAAPVRSAIDTCRETLRMRTGMLASAKQE